LFITKSYVFFGEFLTDHILLFEIKLYDYLFLEQIKKYAPEIVFWLGFFGLISFFIKGNNTIKVVCQAFVFGSIVYIILASKAIFFHNYYTAIIMFPLIIGATNIITLLRKSYKGKTKKLLFLLIILTIIIVPSYNSNVDRISKERDLENLNKVAEFIEINMGPEQIFIDDSYLPTLTLMTGRGRVEEYHLISPEIKETIKNEGFGSALNKYDIIFLISTHREPRYERYVNLFVEEDLEGVAYRRRERILSIITPEREYFSDMSIRTEIIERESINDKFTLVERFGEYRIYSFSN